MDTNTLKELTELLAKELPCRAEDDPYDFNESLTIAEFLRQNAESIEWACEDGSRERIRDLARLVGLNALRLIEASRR